MVKINTTIMDGAGPFYFEGNRIGIIIIHGGGGGTCADLKPLAEDLHKKGGYTINIPLLPGYGTSPEDLKNIHIVEWKSCLDKELDALKEKCESIFIGGHSLGGVLALILAAKDNVDGVFTIGAPIGIRKFLFHLVPFFQIFVKYHKIPLEQFKKDTNGKWIGYDKIPLNITKKVKILLKDMKKSLIHINCPAILIQGCKDSEIKKKSMDYLYKNINSKKKKKVWLKKNEHPILESPDHNQIISELLNFINEICP